MFDPQSIISAVSTAHRATGQCVENTTICNMIGARGMDERAVIRIALDRMTARGIIQRVMKPTGYGYLPADGRDARLGGGHGAG